MIIGITGSIGSGKTTVANIFGKHGFKIINADEIAHNLIQKNSASYKKLRNFFGDGILDRNKSIDKKKLGDIAFSDKIKLKKLNSIMHPTIIKQINSQKNSLKENFFENIIIDAPLLLETGAKKLVDKVVVVKTGRENIIKMLKKRYSIEKIENILNSQMPVEEKIRYADFVIENDKDLNHLKEEVEKILTKLGLVEIPQAVRKLRGS